jgi:hypothetical protein
MLEMSQEYWRTSKICPIYMIFQINRTTVLLVSYGSSNVVISFFLEYFLRSNNSLTISKITFKLERSGLPYYHLWLRLSSSENSLVSNRVSSRSAVIRHFVKCVECTSIQGDGLLKKDVVRVYSYCHSFLSNGFTLLFNFRQHDIPVYAVAQYFTLFSF